jgi:hypothetical protein
MMKTCPQVCQETTVNRSIDQGDRSLESSVIGLQVLRGSARPADGGSYDGRLTRMSSGLRGGIDGNIGHMRTSRRDSFRRQRGTSSLESGSQAFGITLDKEFRDLRSPSTGERITQLEQSHTNDLRAAGMRITLLLQQIDEGVDPFGFVRIKADGQSSVPPMSIARVGRCHRARPVGTANAPSATTTARGMAEGYCPCPPI